MLREDHSQVATRGPEDVRLGELLANLVAELPEPYLTVLTMVEIGGVSFDETGVAMALSPASVRLLHTEGRRRLREVVRAHSEAGRL
jgi:DNA-directed RNA polymerase specialized sigma24 family protein